MECLGMCCFLVFVVLLFCPFFVVWAEVIYRMEPRHPWLWTGASVPAYVLVLVLCFGAISFYPPPRSGFQRRRRFRSDAGRADSTLVPPHASSFGGYVLGVLC